MNQRIFILGEEGRYANYRRAVEAAGGQAVFSEVPGAARDCDGLLLPGGGDLEPWRYGQLNTASRGLEPERDAAELLLLEQFAAAGKPVLGICRGLQTVNVFFGGTLVQDLPNHGAADGEDRLHPVRTARSSLSPVCGEEAVVNSAHHQAVDRLGEGLRPSAWAPEGFVEALEHQSRPVYGVQFHPERMKGPETGPGHLIFTVWMNRIRRSSE